MEKTNAKAPLPVRRTLLMIIPALIMVIGVSALAIKLGLCVWIVWLGMCLWMTTGAATDLKGIAKVWLSAAFGLTVGYLLISGKVGTVGMGIGFCLVGFFIFGMVGGRFGYICNNCTAIFLTCTTASGLILEPLQMAGSVLFGFCAFGLVPYFAFKIIAQKRQKAGS